MKRTFSLFVLSIPLLAADAVTVHDWGTFTAKPASSSEADLPCFVYRIRPADRPWTGAAELDGSAMSFYAQEPVSLNVQLDFANGWFAAWYPGAASSLSRLAWEHLEVRTGDDAAFPVAQPTGRQRGHVTFVGSEDFARYNAARRTDAAPLRITDRWHQEHQEKMLYYRGLGSFEPALQPRRLEDGRIELRNAEAEPIPAVIVFENLAGKIGYRVIRDLREQAVVAALEPNASIEEFLSFMQTELQNRGLFAKEAAAMLAGWTDFWLKPGLRAFYFVPPAAIDQLLPLQITPAPASVTRLLLGRIDMETPVTPDPGPLLPGSGLPALTLRPLPPRTPVGMALCRPTAPE